jgi:hypothetical protein
MRVPNDSQRPGGAFDEPLLTRDRELRAGPLEEIIRGAWSVGRAIDLSGIGYGRIHWGNGTDIVTKPSPYYFFLAGFARVCNAARICEIGTHWGGSTRALRRGVRAGSKPEIVTIDVTNQSDGMLTSEDGISKIVGDAGSEEVVRAVAASFAGGSGIDLLFIDSQHSFVPTWSQYCQYTTLLRPIFTILDDIALNEEMSEVWKLVRESVPPGEALDANEIEPGIRCAGRFWRFWKFIGRETKIGFGLVRFKQNFR